MSGLGLEAAKLSHSNNLIKSTEHDKSSKTQIAYTFNVSPPDAKPKLYEVLIINYIKC